MGAEVLQLRTSQSRSPQEGQGGSCALQLKALLASQIWKVH